MYHSRGMTHLHPRIYRIPGAIRFSVQKPLALAAKEKPGASTPAFQINPHCSHVRESD
jgi:hypothetical protein